MSTIITLDNLKLYLDIAETEDSQDDELNLYLNAVNEWIDTYCDRVFDSTSYTHEEYNGTGTNYLYLHQYPVTAINQISKGRQNAIRIKNTATDATRATVDIDTSESLMTLTVVGGTSASTSTLSLTAAANDTLSELVTAIEALGNSWNAEMIHSDYNSILSTELLEVAGMNAGADRGRGATFRDLDITDSPIDRFKFNPDNGEIYFSQGWGSGYNNIIVDYTAGYTSSTMPKDLQKAAMMLCKQLWDKSGEDGFGTTSIDTGSLNVEYIEDSMTQEVKMILDRYKKQDVTG